MQSTPYSDYVLETNSIEIEAPSQDITVNSKTVTYNFLEWEDGNSTNPRTRTPNDHFNVTSKYKGHLVSNNSIATGYNNGRRVAVDDFGNIHMVYVDNGAIWYTYSTNGGTTWQPELRLSNRFGNNSQPSICIEGTSPYKISVVWQVYDGNYYHTNWRTKVSGSWGAEISSSDFELGSSVAANPVAIYRGYLYMVRKVDGGLALYHIDDTTYDLLDQLPGTNNNSKNPSISAPVYYPSGLLHMVWEDNNKIYYTKYTIGSGFSSREEVSVTYSGIYVNEHPSISCGLDGKVNVSWDAFNVYYNANVLLHRQRTSSQWLSLNEVYYSYSDITRPSIGSYTNSSYSSWFNVAFNFYTSGQKYVRLIQYQNGSWVWPGLYDAGYYPALPDRADEQIVAWTENTTAQPYFIKRESFPLAGSMSKVSVTDATKEFEIKYRREVHDLTKSEKANLAGHLEMALGDIRLHSTSGTQAISFDTASGISFLQSESFKVTKDMDYLTFRIKSHLPDSSRFFNNKLPLFQVNLLEASNKNNLVRIRQTESDIFNSAFSWQDSLIIDLKPYAGKELILQMKNNFNNSSKPFCINVSEFYPDGNYSLAKKNSAFSRQFIPQDFKLHESYPNPFNPTATIVFDLPDAQNVNLEVYNVRGQKIATLVNGFKDSGRHQITFDGTGLASGIYIYRIQTSKYSAVKRMLLLK